MYHHRHLHERARRLVPAMLLLAVTAGLLAVGLTSPYRVFAAGSADFELWPDRDSRPPLADIEFLPIFTDDEDAGFVNLGYNVSHAGRQWRALQFTHDKEFTLEVTAGKWLRG